MMLDREASQIILWEDNLTKLKLFKKDLKSEKDGVLIKGVGSCKFLLYATKE